MRTTELRSVTNRGLRGALLSATLLLAFLRPAVSALAQNLWVANGVGNWNVAANWSMGVPTAASSPEINNGGTAQLYNTGVSTDLVWLGDESDEVGTLEVLGGAAHIEVVGIIVGVKGRGTLRIADAGRIAVSNVFLTVIGYATDSNGTVTVDGPGSMLESPRGLYVGLGGEATLSIIAGGVVSGELDVGRGFNSSGTLSITGGGTLSNTIGYIGNVEGSSGAATVTGANSTWTNSGDLSVGRFGAGELNITGGGRVSNNSANIGAGSDSHGMAAINGSGSVWANSSVLAVGSAGDGALEITGGGVVTSTIGRIARSAGSTGMVLIDGPGSRWSTSGEFTMGLFNTGTATLTVQNRGVLSAAGGISVQGLGTVRGDGTIIGTVSNYGGTVAPGGATAGTLHITGNYNLTAARLQIDLASNSSFDKLAVTGNFTFGGLGGNTLEVSLAGGYVPHGNQSFDVLDWGNLAGSFDSISLPTLGGMLVWNTSQLYTTGVLTVTGPPSPAGDFDLDGDVDGRDFLVWQRDPNVGDLADWQANYGMSSLTATNIAVPEPSSLAVCVAGLMLAASVRFRKTDRAPLLTRSWCARETLIAQRSNASWSKSIMRGLALLVVLVLGNSPAQAAKYWKNGVTTGTWSTGSNWSSTSNIGADNGGAPIMGEAVNIVFHNGVSHHVTYDVAAPTIDVLSIDLINGSATTSMLSLPGNINLNTRGIAVGGYNGAAFTAGRGALNQSGGIVTTSTAGDLALGFGTGSSGVYTLSGGALVSNLNQYVGFNGTGTFNHSGGSNTVNASATGIFSLGVYVSSSGTYNLGGTGTLSVAAHEYIGYEGAGTFNQTGGTHTITSGKSLYLGYEGFGAYTLSSGAMVASGNEYIGYDRTGTFNQTGGTHDIATSLVIAYAVNSNGTYTLSGGSASALDVSVGRVHSNPGDFNRSAATLTVSGTGVLTVGGLLLVANDAFNLSTNTLNLSGGTINAGALDFQSKLSQFNWTAGTLNLTQNVTFGGFSGTSAALGAAKIIGSNQTLMITANETLGGAAAFGLTLNAGGTHTVTGSTTISPNGSLTLNGGMFNTGSLAISGAFNFNSGTLGITGSGGLAVGAGGPLGSTMLINTEQIVNVTNTLTVDSGGYLAVAGGFSAGNLVNNGDLVVINTAIGGPVVNNNAVTVVGAVDFNGLVSGPGDFFGPGTAHFNGGLAVGASPAEVSFEGSVALANTNTLLIEIGGTTPGSEYDLLAIAGSASLDGTLDVSLINGFTPITGQQFTILTADSIVNNGLMLVGSSASLFNLLVSSTSVTLQAISAGLAGDFNFDGDIDGRDFLIWQRGGSPNPLSGSDLADWQANYGETSFTAASNAVPEPAAIVLLLSMIGFWALLRVR